MAFKTLVDRYKEKLYWPIRQLVLNHEDADDILQETFIKVFKNIKGFEGKSSLYTWMYRIALNQSLTFLNKRSKMMKVSVEQYLDEQSDRLIDDNYFDGSAIDIILQKAISQLPDKQRVTFNMRYFQDLSYKQIAEITEQSEGGLKANYFHAVQKIKEFINSNNWEFSHFENILENEKESI
jgi:RNA polymerase sigma-70 factor (ECF subfamily)